MTNQYVKEVPFKNWTKTKFSHMFNSQMYDFEPGGTYSVPSDIALHFAKHLAVRELHAIGTSGAEALPEGLVKEYMEKCFPVKEKQPGVSGSFERLDVKDTTASDTGIKDANKTEETAQKETSEDDDADASDDKNNAGAPLIKGLGRKGKTKDSEYSK